MVTVSCHCIKSYFFPLPRSWSRIRGGGGGASTCYYRPQTKFGASLCFYTCLPVILFTSGGGGGWGGVVSVSGSGRAVSAYVSRGCLVLGPGGLPLGLGLGLRDTHTLWTHLPWTHTPLWAPPVQMAIEVGGTHPAGMHSCLEKFLLTTAWKFKKLDREGAPLVPPWIRQGYPPLFLSFAMLSHLPTIDETADSSRASNNHQTCLNAISNCNSFYYINFKSIGRLYRSGTVNSKSFVGKVLLRIQSKFELN